VTGVQTCALPISAAASAATLAATSWAGLASGCAGVAALHAAAGEGPRAPLAALRPFAPLLLFTLLLQLALTPGTPLLPPPLAAAPTAEGLAAAAQALARLAGAIAAAGLLVRTTSPRELGRSVGWALSPATHIGFPVREATLAITLAFHFFPLLLTEGRQMRAALEARGVSARRGPARLRLRAMQVWALAVLFGTAERSARLVTALEARGFALPGAGRPRFASWNAASSLLVAAGAALLAAGLLL
jgi:energy-coupling factor transport system permease protein